MEKRDLLNEKEKGNFRLEDSKDQENLNDVGAPPLVIVVQGGKNVNHLKY